MLSWSDFSDLMTVQLSGVASKNCYERTVRLSEANAANFVLDQSSDSLRI